MSGRPGLDCTGFPPDSRTTSVTPLESAHPGCSLSGENKGLTVTKFPSQPLCLQHLRDPLVSVLSKRLITPVESALTENAAVTPLESALTKNIGGGGHHACSPPGLPFHPVLHAPFQHVQRHRAILEHRVMKLTHVEFRTQLFLCFRAQLADLELPQLVGQCLSRPDDVTVHLHGDVLIGLAGVVLEKLDR